MVLPWRPFHGSNKTLFPFILHIMVPFCVSMSEPVLDFICTLFPAYKSRKGSFSPCNCMYVVASASNGLSFLS